jgi:hypothetical protein
MSGVTGLETAGELLLWPWSLDAFRRGAEQARFL